MRIPRPFLTCRRKDCKTFFFSLNRTCGLPERVCSEWQRCSFSTLPDELSHYRYPKSKAAADAAVIAFINFLKGKQKNGFARLKAEDITVGNWIKKFVDIETSPRSGINASKNKPYSVDTLDGYRGNYVRHIKDDPICGLKMGEVEEADILEYITRLSVKKLKNGKQIGGSRTFVVTVAFMRMAFNEYQRINKLSKNPFQFVAVPKSNKRPWDALPEEEMLKLFMPGVLTDTMELAVCSAIFLSGLRRAEVSALMPEDLDWATPKIVVCQSWQRFNNRNRVLGPTKGKKVREVPFDFLLQNSIRRLWEENGQHDFVFCNKDGKVIGPSWIKGRFKKWLERAGIELGGRRIVPHSSRHSIASLLEARGVSLRYIQDFLGHSDLKTTKNYLHSTSKTIRDIGNKISDIMNQQDNSNIIKLVN
jgi:integrase